MTNTLNKKLPNQRQILQETEEEIESPPGPKELIGNLFKRENTDDSLEEKNNNETKDSAELDIVNLSGVELETLKSLQEIQDSEEFKREIELLKKNDPEIGWKNIFRSVGSPFHFPGQFGHSGPH